MPTQDWTQRLTMLTLVAPASAQLVLMVVMAVEGRWLFVAMVVPGLVGCLASLLLAVVRHRQERRDRLAAAAPAASESADSDQTPGVDIARFATMPLESLLGLDRDPLPWRRIVALWLREPSLRAPLGVCANGVAMIDLVRQGPHALVAGTTGSGKSMLLQSWCLALAVRNTPQSLRFVFLDFKGGAAFNRLDRLPHAVGSVCDLDLAHAVRALRALEGELTRRERLVAQALVGSFDMLGNPPPRLVVVIDEFHALRSQLPDGIDRLVRVASLGRSLGMHVIACTQNPLGQVGADMKANMSLNICLRVRDGLQSSELIGSTAAARISPLLPGAAYCADGESTVALRCCPPGHIDAMVDAVVRAAAFHRCEPAEPLFTPPLPRHIASLREAVRYGVRPTRRKTEPEDAVHAGKDATVHAGNDAANTASTTSTTYTPHMSHAAHTAHKAHAAHQTIGADMADPVDVTTSPITMRRSDTEHDAGTATTSAVNDVNAAGATITANGTTISHTQSITRTTPNSRTVPRHHAPVPFGLGDDGVRLHIATLPIGNGNIVIVGPHGCGKSMLLAVLEHALRASRDVTVRTTTRGPHGYRTSPDHTAPDHVARGSVSTTDVPPPPQQPHVVWLCDDADALLDPFTTDDTGTRIHEALIDPRTTVIVAVEQSRHIRDPARWAARLVFPTGDRATDMMDGIPAETLAELSYAEPGLPGRAVLLTAGRAEPVQCLAGPDSTMPP